MYRTALRSASRPVVAGLRTTMRPAVPRRFASTAAAKQRSWKGSAVRLGLAFAAVYYYNTSPVFADEVTAHTIPAPASFTQDDLPTVDSVLAEKRKQIQSRPSEPAEKTPEPSAEAQNVAVEGGPAALEEEADQQGAFNPETGEINWDCPCLGGMAHGPCGEEFKTAFSCFVYSKEEPKGMDCIEKFQGMQECFKQYPEIYGAELADDEDDAEPVEGGAEIAAPAQKVATESAGETVAEKAVSDSIPVRGDEAVSVSPEKAVDATPANGEVKEEKKPEVKAEKKTEKAEKVEKKVEEQKA